MTLDLDRRRRFESLVAEVFEPLQRYLLRRATAQDAEEALADVLLVLWRRLDEVPSGSALPWSYGVARRTLANQRRGAERRSRLIERLGNEAVASARNEGEDDEDPDLQRALGSLSPKDREVIHLWAWEQLEPREIALVLGSSTNSVSLRLSRARRKLAAQFPRQDSSSAGQIGDESTERRVSDER